MFICWSASLPCPLLPYTSAKHSSMRAQLVVVTCAQLLSVVQLWLLPCLLSSLFFNGMHNFFIISASVMCIPILFNLVVVSHYWMKPLLIVGLLVNGIGGAGAIVTVIVAWADPTYQQTKLASPNLSEGTVIMLLVGGMLSFSASLDLILAFLVKSREKAYSCCWGNFSESPGVKVRAESRFVHWIRVMRTTAALVFLANLFQIWALVFWYYSSYIRPSAYGVNTATLILRLRILSLFYFVMTCVWSASAGVMSFNVNSSRKLRFLAFNSLLVLLLSAFFIVVFFAAGLKTFGLKGLGPAPWIIIFNLPLQLLWIIAAFILAYSKYPFRHNSCCWPDCTPTSTLQQEFDIWQEEEPHQDHPEHSEHENQLHYSGASFGDASNALEETDGL